VPFLVVPPGWFPVRGWVAPSVPDSARLRGGLCRLVAVVLLGLRRPPARARGWGRVLPLLGSLRAGAGGRGWFAALLPGGFLRGLGGGLRVRAGRGGLVCWRCCLGRPGWRGWRRVPLVCLGVGIGSGGVCGISAGWCGYSLS